MTEPPDSNTYHRIVNGLIESIFFLHSESYRALGCCVLDRRCWAGSQRHLILYYSGWGRCVDGNGRDSPFEKLVSHKNDFKSIIFSASAALHRLRIKRRIGDAGEEVNPQ